MSGSRGGALGAAFASGALLALQARMNGTLSAHSSRPVIAALWSFGSGLLVLLVIAALSTRVRAAARQIPAAVRNGRLAWWQCVGGAIGGVFVAVQTWTVPMLGVAVFSVATLAGQTVGGLGVDRAGLSPTGVRAISWSRGLFATMAVLAVAISSSGRGAGSVDIPLWAVLVAVLTGAGVALQQGLNGQVNRAVGQPLATTLQNFAFGVLVLVVLAGAQAVTTPGDWQLPAGVPWWAWFGGMVGIGFVALTAWAVGHLGVLVFGLVSVSAQLSTAVLLDLWEPATRATVGPALVAGVLVSLAAAIGAGASSARAARPPALKKHLGSRSSSWQDGKP